MKWRLDLEKIYLAFLKSMAYVINTVIIVAIVGGIVWYVYAILFQGATANINWAVPR